MKKQKHPIIKYYQSFTDDFVQSRVQDYTLPEDYRWIHSSLIYRAASHLVYLAALLFCAVYSRLVLHVRIVNRRILKPYAKTGCFLYGNHTQPVGDAFVPARAVFPKRIYTVVSPANLSIPVLGPLLPMLGALPLPGKLSQMQAFTKAIDTRFTQKRCIVIYPEAHVWPWCTKIRPFPAASFAFPVEHQSPVFCMTTTYQKRRYRKKPSITLYLDGPFFPASGISKKQQKEQLKDTVFHCMCQRSQNSNYDYIQYQRRS